MYLYDDTWVRSGHTIARTTCCIHQAGFVISGWRRVERAPFDHRPAGLNTRDVTGHQRAYGDVAWNGHPDS